VAENTLAAVIDECTETITSRVAGLKAMVDESHTLAPAARSTRNRRLNESRARQFLFTMIDWMA